MHLQRPAQLFTHPGGQLHVKTPVVAVVSVGKGEGVLIHADDKGPRLGRRIGRKRVCLFSKADHVGTKPFAAKLVDRALGVELLERGDHIVIHHVVVAKSHRIVLLDQRHDRVHPVGYASAARKGEHQHQRQQQTDQFFSHICFTKVFILSGCRPASCGSRASRIPSSRAPGTPCPSHRPSHSRSASPAAPDRCPRCRGTRAKD